MKFYLILTEEFDQKFKSFNTEYKKKDALIQEQKKLIEERNRNLKALQERVKQLEQKLEEEASSKDHQTKHLKKQLELQSDQIAQLTYQLHQLNKTKSLESQEAKAIYVGTNQPVSAKKKSLTTNRFESNERSLELDSAGLQSSLVKFPIKVRRNSAYSVKSETSDEQMGATGILEQANLLNQPKRSNSSNSNNPSNSVLLLTDRSSTPPLHKMLPPVVKRSSENVPPPDPKPFLQSAASTLHSRTKKDLIQRRTLISLPPINKTFELNHLAVESPHKHSSNNSNKIEHNNSSAN